jgi:hypothetical protein
VNVVYELITLNALEYDNALLLLFSLQLERLQFFTKQIGVIQAPN